MTNTLENLCVQTLLFTDNWHYLLLSSSSFSLLLFSASSWAKTLAFSCRTEEFWDSKEASWDLMDNSSSAADRSFSTATASWVWASAVQTARKRRLKLHGQLCIWPTVVQIRDLTRSRVSPSLSEMFFSSFSQDAVWPPSEACRFSICRSRGRVAEVTLWLSSWFLVSASCSLWNTLRSCGVD